MHSFGALIESGADRGVLPSRVVRLVLANHAWLPRQKPMPRLKTFSCSRAIASIWIARIHMRLCSTCCAHQLCQLQMPLTQSSWNLLDCCQNWRRTFLVLFLPLC